MTNSSSSTSSKAWHWWVNAVAFVSIVIIGVVLLLSVLGLQGEIPGVMQQVANALAYVVVGACSLIYVTQKMRRKNGFWYMIIWVGAVILITLYYIIPLFR